MALVKKQLSSKRLFTLGGVFAVVVVVLIYVLTGGGDSDELDPSLVNAPAVGGPGIVQDLGESLFTDPRFEKLQPHSERTVVPGDVGRENPFSEPRR